MKLPDDLLALNDAVQGAANADMDPEFLKLLSDLDIGMKEFKIELARIRELHRQEQIRSADRLRRALKDAERARARN